MFWRYPSLVLFLYSLSIFCIVCLLYLIIFRFWAWQLRMPWCSSVHMCSILLTTWKIVWCVKSAEEWIEISFWLWQRDGHLMDYLDYMHHQVGYGPEIIAYNPFAGTVQINPLKFYLPLVEVFDSGFSQQGKSIYWTWIWLYKHSAG